MSAAQLEALAWPASRLGDAIATLIRKGSIGSPDSKPVLNPTAPNELASEHSLSAWIEWCAKRLGCEAEPIESTLGDLGHELPRSCPALIQLSPALYLAALRGTHKTMYCVTPAGTLRRISVRALCTAICEPALANARADFDDIVRGLELPPSREQAIVRFLAGERLAEKRWTQCWKLRGSPGMPVRRWLHGAHALPNASMLAMTHAAQYLLWLTSWVIMGRLSFQGRMDRGWLFAWALLLLTIIPFRLLTTWTQGLLAVGVGALLKRRLLFGATRLAPDEMRHCGMGSFLAQALEAEAVETLALGGGIQAALAAIELAVSGFVLGRYAILLVLWCGVTVALAWRFLRNYERWTQTRLSMTHEVVESMVGHRTRIAQQPRAEWHEDEDRMLAGYMDVSHPVDRVGTLFITAIPRGWLMAGIASLAPAIVSGERSGVQAAVVMGGILLAFTAFRRLTASFTEIIGAYVAWKRISPLFRAASRPERVGEVPPQEHSRSPADTVVEADGVTFRYRKEGSAALDDCSLAIRRGDRILLEGPSGGGKTTLATLLCGIREPQSGLLLVNGGDRYTLGTDCWRKHVAAAPQFHENHILTETLAFNLLMGRRWPPTQTDIQLAESICRRLGLGELLDTMPSGLQQMVGEGGWQLSHGERSRIYIARALLQNSELVILDESFAALDPENLRRSLTCTLDLAKTVMVIAHP